MSKFPNWKDWKDWTYALQLRNCFILDRDGGVEFYYIPRDIRDDSLHRNSV